MGPPRRGWDAIRSGLSISNKNAGQGEAAARFKSLAIAAAYIQASQRGATQREYQQRQLQEQARAGLKKFEQDDSDASGAMPPYSLLCLSRANPLRRAAIRAVTHKYYEAFTLVLIVLSCTTLALDSTRAGFPDTTMGGVLVVLEYVWAGLMCAEISLRVVARGLILPKNAFLRSGWGVLDVVVVLLGFLNLLPGAQNLTAVRAFRVLRPLRAVGRLPNLKVLVITLLTSLPMLMHVVVLAALVYFAYGIVGVQVFEGVLRFSCGAPDFSGAYPAPGPLGTTVLMNVTYSIAQEEAIQTCRGPKLRDPAWYIVPGASPDTSTLQPDVLLPAGPPAAALAPAGLIYSSAVLGSDLVNASLYGSAGGVVQAMSYSSYADVRDTSHGRQCDAGLYCVEASNPNYGITSFDYIIVAWLTIFQCITQEGWTDIMYQTQDALNYWVWPYYVSMIVLGSLFLMNLALVVLYVQFTKSEAAVRNNAAREEELARKRLRGEEGDDESHGGSTSSEDEEDEAAKEAVQKELRHKQGAFPLPSFNDSVQHAPHTRWHRVRGVLHDTARSHQLYTVSIIAIIINTVVMCINWYGMPNGLAKGLKITNVVLTVYFTIELAIKVIGIGPRRLFRDGMNVFDAVVVAASIVEVVIELLPDVGGVGPLSVLRTLRFLRLARVVQRWAGLRRVIQTLLRSVRSVAWMSLLMLLFLVIAALLGQQVFGYQFQFCDYVRGSSPVCPLGQSAWGAGRFCPDHYLCYLPCSVQQANTWLQVPGSQFFDQAYCQEFCADGSYSGDGRGGGNRSATDPGLRCDYLAAVGQSAVPISTFDNFGWSLLTVFQILTGENWNLIMYDGMRSVGDASALYFIFTIIVGNYVVLNLFIAILLENFAANLDSTATQDTVMRQDDDDTGAKERTDSFVRAEMEADRAWVARTFGPHAADAADWALDDEDHGRLGRSVSARSAWSESGNGSGNGNGKSPASEHNGVNGVSKGLNALARIKARIQGTGRSTHSSPGSSPSSSPERPSAGPPGVSNQVRPVGQGRLDPDGLAAEAQAEDVLRQVDASSPSYFAGQVNRMGTMDSEVQRKLNQQEFMRGRSMWLFGPDSVFRWRCMTVVTWKWFDAIILAFITCSSVALALDSPGLSRTHPEMARVLRYLDVVWITIFMLEAGLKVVTFGFLLNGRQSYLRDPWNVMDFIIVLSSIPLLYLEFALVGAQDENNVAMLRALRALRALRPLRIASTSEQLKVVISALFSSLRALVHVGVVCLLFYLLFGILGVSLFKGELRYCADGSGELLESWTVLPQGQSINRTWCEAGPHLVDTSHYLSSLNLTLPVPGLLSTEWNNRPFNFDHLGYSILSLFSCATMELWVDIMSSAIAAVAPEQQPVRGHAPAVSIFFVAFLVIGSFLVLNLLVAITIEKFSELHSRQLGYNLFLTVQQQQWVDVQRMLVSTRPERQPQRPDTTRYRALVYDTIMSRRFQLFMYGVVITNVLVMCLEHYGMSAEWNTALWWADVVFTACFVVEAALQVFALGPRSYFADNWYVMLFLIAIVGVVSVTLDAVGIHSYGLAPLLRVLRVTRFLRIITSVEGLHHLVRTLFLALPAIANVGSVLLLFFFVYAVLGMNLFADIKYGQYLTRHANFKNWPSSMMVLFRLITGESWDGIMADCMIANDCVLVTANTTSPNTGQSLLAGEYYSPGSEVLAGVPAGYLNNQCTLNRAVTVIFFVTFELLCSYIIINIVVAIMLEGMINDEADELLPVPRSAVQQYVQVWSDLDPSASGYIRAQDLPVLIMELYPPLGNRGTRSMRWGAQDIILSVDIPNRGNKVHFLEVLHALAGRICGAELPDMTEDRLYNQLVRHLPAEAPNPTYTAAHFHAAMHVQAAVKGFLARYAMRDKLAQFYRALAEMEDEDRQVDELQGRLATAVVSDAVVKRASHKALDAAGLGAGGGGVAGGEQEQGAGVGSPKGLGVGGSLLHEDSAAGSLAQLMAGVKAGKGGFASAAAVMQAAAEAESAAQALAKQPQQPQQQQQQQQQAGGKLSRLGRRLGTGTQDGTPAASRQTLARYDPLYGTDSDALLVPQSGQANGAGGSGRTSVDGAAAPGGDAAGQRQGQATSAGEPGAGGGAGGDEDGDGGMRKVDSELLLLHQRQPLNREESAPDLLDRISDMLAHGTAGGTNGKAGEHTAAGAGGQLPHQAPGKPPSKANSRAGKGGSRQPGSAVPEWDLVEGQDGELTHGSPAGRVSVMGAAAGAGTAQHLSSNLAAVSRVEAALQRPGAEALMQALEESAYEGQQGEGHEGQEQQQEQEQPQRSEGSAGEALAAGLEQMGKLVNPAAAAGVLADAVTSVAALGRTLVPKMP